MFDPAKLDAMRVDLRFIHPELEREGWSRDEISEVSALVRSHLEAGNDQALAATACWLRSRAGRLLARLQAAYAARKAGEYAVWHDEEAVRALNRGWRRGGERRPG